MRQQDRNHTINKKGVQVAVRAYPYLTPPAKFPMIHSRLQPVWRTLAITGLASVAPTSQKASHVRSFCCCRPQCVKWFNDAKGFGFITPDDGGEDLFAHFSSIQMTGFKTLKEGQRVAYEVIQGPKGKQALNITATA